MVRDPAAETIEHERPASSEQEAAVLDDLPLSALFVRYVLRHVGPLTTTKILSELGGRSKLVHPEDCPHADD